MLKEASPRIGRATSRRWEIISNYTLHYQFTPVPYMVLVRVEIELKGNMKLCHWGCLDANGRPTILSSGE
jgi:hypothetical protein